MKIFNYVGIAILTMFIAVACDSAGAEGEVSTAKDVAEKPHTALDYTLDVATSKVLWEGTKSTGKTHHGTIDIKSGEIHVVDGKITSGSFVIDMTTINDLDLEEPYQSYLEAHLMGTAEGKEDDFFNVNKYPTAKFEITKVVDLNGSTEANTMIYGNLTIKDATHNVGFKAQVDINGDLLKATAPKFKIDRTKWGVMFQSKSILDNLKDGFINDAIGITLQITAKKK